MVKNPPIEPSRREVLSGLAILIVLGGVAVSRSGSPQSSWASGDSTPGGAAKILDREAKSAPALATTAPESVATAKNDLVARDQAITDD